MTAGFGTDWDDGVGTAGITGVDELRELRVLEPAAGGSNYVSIQAPTLAANWTLTLPVDDGTANQFLQTDGSGTLAWAAVVHANTTSLTADDHTQYVLLLGRASSQIVRGGTAASETLTLRGTSHATVGSIFLNDLGGNVIVGGGTTASTLRLLEPSGSG